MKIFGTLILFTTLTILSCNQNKKKSVVDSVHPSDTDCIKELNEAKKDIKNKKIVYCKYVGNISFRPLRAEREMDSLLNLQNIEFQNESSPCVVEENRNYHCYCELMQEKIEEKFGKKFIDSLLYIADDIYISKKLDKTFDYTEFDKCALFPGDKTYDYSNHNGLQEQFDKIVKYPKNYKYTECKEGCWAIIQIDIEVNEFGGAKVKSVVFETFNSDTKEENYNTEFNDYFKKTAITLIESTKWIPAKIKSHNIKSKNTINIYLK